MLIKKRDTNKVSRFFLSDQYNTKPNYLTIMGFEEILRPAFLTSTM